MFTDLNRKLLRVTRALFIFHEKELKIEPPHDKTNTMACAPSEDSYQPMRPQSLIRIFAVHMKKATVLSYTLSTQ